MSDHSVPSSLTITDRIHGTLIGSAAGDALGYAIEFNQWPSIQAKYGSKGITSYEIEPSYGKALISDDTQMTLFTANGLLNYLTAQALKRGNIPLRSEIALAYNVWLATQYGGKPDAYPDCWISRFPELYSLRAPGNTCLSALSAAEFGPMPEDFIAAKRNDSKGCGGIMRVSPLACVRWNSPDELDIEAAQAAAITHGHPLGYIPAAMFCHILYPLIFQDVPKDDLVGLVRDSVKSARRLFGDSKYMDLQESLIEKAIAFSGNHRSDPDNIHDLGGGWVAEETLAIAVYCFLRYSDNFDAGLIASVNHSGDSDSTGAVAGAMLGARCGYRKIGRKWIDDLELHDLILTIADDLSIAATEDSLPVENPIWAAHYPCFPF